MNLTVSSKSQNVRRESESVSHKPVSVSRYHDTVRTESLTLQSIC